MKNWNFPYNSRRMVVMGNNVVATSQPLSSQAGLLMLHNGGNAVDAVLASAIALTILEPTGNGIGSDCFALVWDGSKLHGINGSGRAPAAWNRERFAHLDEMPKHGWDSVTIPGAVSAWSELSRQFGRLPFAKLFEPAIRYASSGFPVSPITAARWGEAAEKFCNFEGFRNTFLTEGRAPVPGEIFTLPDGAETLAEIAETKGESFYRGDLARTISRASADQGGVMTFDDLASHRAEWVAPLSQRYRGYELYEIPPNGQGIAALIAMGILDCFDIAKYPVDTADSIHLQAEAMKLAFSDVFAHIADLESMKIDPRSLLDPVYLQQRAESIDLKKARFPECGIPRERGTVCLSAADAGGMMVSFIQSNFHGFGSGVIVPGTGISLNNRGFGFSLDGGHPNCVAGGKKPFHTIIPGFVMKNSQPVMSFGVMGAHMQAQGHVQMMTRIFDYDQNPQSASDAPRWQVMPDLRLALESGFGQEVEEELRSRGHELLLGEPEHIFGGAQLIMKSGDGYISGSDHRKDGQAVCF